MLVLQFFKCEKDHYTKPGPAGDQFYQSLSKIERNMAKKLDKEREVFKQEVSRKDDDTLASPGVFDVPVPAQRTETLPLEDMDSIIMSSKPNLFYHYFLSAQMKLFKLAQTYLVDLSDHDPTRKASYRLVQQDSGMKNLPKFRLEAHDNMEQLVCVLKTLQSLRECSGRAADSSHLTEDELKALKIKLLAFDNDSQYSKATQLVSYSMEYEPRLVNERSHRWWDISDYDAMEPHNPPKAPKKLAAPIPQFESMRSTLSFVVPTISLLSVVPAAIAWKYGDSVLGSTADSNFWQAVSGSILQLLGLFTFVWPTLSSPRLSQLAWVWIWMLAGFSAICAIVSVPVYLVVPTVWSFGISFAGMLAQAVVQLQVINAI